MIKILYVSSLCSEPILKYVFDTAINKPEQAAQKFHRLLAEGFALNRANCSIETLSSIPVTPASHKKKIWFFNSEIINHLRFRYIPLLNLRFFKNLGVFFYTFFWVLFWGWFRVGQKKLIICDVLNMTVSLAAFLASKLSFTKNITIVTDLPYNVMPSWSETESFFSMLYHKLTRFMLYRFDGYILLTEQMNSVVNPKKRPYLIMEGLVDITMENSVNSLNQKSTDKILIYAGGLYEKYGVKTLIDAFLETKGANYRLHLYGNGDQVKHMPAYMEKDPRIVYKGVVPNQQVVSDQLVATLLVNPRPSTEEFTKYSFPSKNMEYMVSGTPMLTNILPGMPKEYFEYVFLNKEETVAGMATSLSSILCKTAEELHSFGQTAQKFVLKEKNNKKQAARILDFYESLHANKQEGRSKLN